MTFKKTITYSASVSDYENDVVSARVYAQNQVLSQFVNFILNQNLNLQSLDKISIGDTAWSRDPLDNSNTVYPDFKKLKKSQTDCYFIGNNVENNVLGITVDFNRLIVSLTPSPTKESETQYYTDSNYASYGRILTSQMRVAYDNGQYSYDNAYKLESSTSLELTTFDPSLNTVTLTFDYWKSPTDLVIKIADNAIVLSKNPNACFLLNSYGALCFSFDSPFLMNETTYGDNSEEDFTYNINLNLGTSGNPYRGRQNNYPAWNGSTAQNNEMTCVTIYGINKTGMRYDYNIENNNFFSDRTYPTMLAFGFPRIKNGELYMRKQYIPMTYPAVFSPVKLGYTTGLLQGGSVYNINTRNFVCLNNGLYGYFVEVFDQDAQNE